MVQESKRWSISYEAPPFVKEFEQLTLTGL
jgi:hypothetical protein